MPLYEYKCLKCGYVFELLQKATDLPLMKCGRCGSPARKILSPNRMCILLGCAGIDGQKAPCLQNTRGFCDEKIETEMMDSIEGDDGIKGAVGKRKIIGAHPAVVNVLHRKFPAHPLATFCKHGNRIVTTEDPQTTGASSCKDIRIPPSSAANVRHVNGMKTSRQMADYGLDDNWICVANMGIPRSDAIKMPGEVLRSTHTDYPPSTTGEASRKHDDSLANSTARAMRRAMTPMEHPKRFSARHSRRRILQKEGAICQAEGL